MSTTVARSRGPIALTSIAAAVMVVSLFLPYATRGEESISVFKMVTSLQELQEVGDGATLLYGIVVAIVGVVAVCSLLALILSLTNKGIGALIFAVIALLLFVVFNDSFKPSGSMGVGFGLILFYVAAAAAIGGSIWMIVAKRKAKVS